MEFYSGCTYGFMEKKGFSKSDDWARASLKLMFEETGSDTLLYAATALQDHAYSVKVDCLTDDVASEEDITRCIRIAKEMGKKVILKAIVNCRDGYWRAYIHFFDKEVNGESGWHDWFESYGEYVLHLARIAEKTKAEMLCVGCEMIGTDARSAEWRELIKKVRGVYHGLITYNCDKYQENNVEWWDAVDVISSSGYYPIDKLDENFERIKRVSESFSRPFMFMECGCPSREGSEFVPNDWRAGGEQSLAAQERWYKAFTDELLKNPWVRGTGWWDWSASRLCPAEKAAQDAGYGVYNKPAAAVLRRFNELRVKD
ncbi:MAG: 1,4-beta-xylanase [Eubacteriales bacterium]|nr:1,4-beta-xylanase [Eubacteriales bacterium]MDD3883118.1 1,4-beta-xylanase [Eubacteriales bacterium]MDD4513312.1 1,4-beta-xylanase [Eubacteriales bacterium]